MSSAAQAFRVGLTGGIASGKSVVAEMFAEAGAVVLDSDQIAREVVEPGQPALDTLVAALGPRILAPDGRLDRAALRRRIFADASLRHRVGAILHPAIRAELERQSRVAAGPYQVLVIPLLVEGQGEDRVDRVLVVDAPESLQLERLMRRDGETEAGARQALSAQATRERRLARADDIITNDSTLESLRQRVLELDRDYRQRAARKAGSE